MENSGLALAAPASYLSDGLAMKDASNHFATQQMDLSDTANIFATPVRNTVDDGAGTSIEASFGSNTLPIVTGEEKALPEGDEMKGQTAQESGHVSAAQTEEPRESIQHNYNALDTPARPTVDHGIESSVRDTLDMSMPETGLFKVESAPQGDLQSLELYELPSNGDLPETETMADPSTPMDPFTASPTLVEEEPSVHQAYAMLKFPDSYFYVKSTNVMITRDEAFRRAYREEKKQMKLRLRMQRAAQQTLDNYAQEPSHHSQYGGDDDDDDLIGRPARALLSTYSDMGGAVSYGEHGYDAFDTTALVHRSRKSKHNSSSNHSIAPRSLHEFEQGDELTGELYLDKEGRTHDPHEWAQVAIHPQDPKDIEKISREHLIIRYDGDKRSWVMDVIGNRVLHNGELRVRGEMDIDLSHNDEIIIISVSFKFMLPADEDPDIMESVEWDDDLETSPAARRISDTIDGIESDADDASSEEDVPLAQQTKPKKVKVKKTKTKEPKPKLLKLKLKNKQASKKAEAQTTEPEDKKEKQKGKAPAKTGGKSGGKSGGKVPAKATKSTPNAEPNPEQPATQTEPEASKSNVEEQAVPSTEAQLVEFAQGGQAPPQGPPPQASPPAPINLDPNSAFAGADPSQLPQKRKGPGRPPKNGLISKRDDAGVKRKIKEYERQNIPIPHMNELLEMVRVEQRQKDAAAKAASRGEAAPESGMQNIDPRMQNYSVPYTSAPPVQPPQSLAAGTDSPHDAQQGAAAARSTSPRPRRPAKSPSPMPAQENFSEEQLKKPTITYVFIIDEILQDPALDGQADLQTIYDKIQKRWPYFKYGTSTNGWQSSVRHNLLQCQRFVESGKSGKGKYWRINFEHELDPKKRKQATPPPQGPPRSGSGGSAYQQPYNASYAQGGNTYNASYNQGAYSAAGPPGSAQTHPNGQPANGQYAQQSQYGSQPPNGNRMASQQPPAAPPQPQPFATIVQAIVAYKPQFLQPHVGKDTHAGAEAQFNQALNHYSELHAGNTPTTEGQIDESQEPFRTMKQIFIQYGQGDTRPKENGTASATTAAPATNPPPSATSAPPSSTSAPPSSTSAPPSSTSNPAPAAVMSTASTSAAVAAPAITSGTPMQSSQPMANAQAPSGTPGSNGRTPTPSMQSQQLQPPSATSNLPPRPPSSASPHTQAPATRPVAVSTNASPMPGVGTQPRAPTAPVQMQAPAVRPIAAAGMQNTNTAPVTGTATQPRPLNAPTQMQATAPRSNATAASPANGLAPQSRPPTATTQIQGPASQPAPSGVRLGTTPAASMVSKPQPPAGSSASSQAGQQINRAAPSSSVTGARPSQPPLVSNTQPAVAPVQQQPKQAPAMQSSAPQPRAQPGPAQQPRPNIASGTLKPQQPIRTTNGVAPHTSSVPAMPPQPSSVQKTVPSGEKGVTPAQVPVKVPHTDQKNAPGVLNGASPAQIAARVTANAPQAPSAAQQSAKQEPLPEVRPSSAGVKRVADDGAEDQAAKRLKASPSAPVSSPKPVLAATSDVVRPPSAGTKRTADESAEDSGPKRVKTTQESGSTSTAP